MIIVQRRKIPDNLSPKIQNSDQREQQSLPVMWEADQERQLYEFVGLNSAKAKIVPKRFFGRKQFIS